jgi:hypothetical protein
MLRTRTKRSTSSLQDLIIFREFHARAKVKEALENADDTNEGYLLARSYTRC